MIHSGTHIIRQQHLDITFEGLESDGMAFQQQIASVCSHQLMPALEAVLEKFAPVNGHLYIDRLEIDLGNIGQQDFEKDLQSVFTKTLETTIRAIVEQPNGGTSTGNVRLINNPTATIEAYLFFLQTGRLPWHYRLPANQSLTAAMDAVLEGPDKHFFLQQLLPLLKEPAIRQRLALQQSDAMKRLLLQQKTSAIDQLLQLFPGDNFTVFRHKIKEAALELLASGNTIQVSACFGTALKLLQSDNSAKAKSCHQHLQQFRDNLPGELSDILQLNAHANLDAAPNPDTHPTFFSPDENGIYIENAGLILLHPFIVRLFEGTGIAKDDRIIDPDRALQLLHYLVTGSDQAPEYELAFSKILCGIPLETPVDTQVQISATDKEEADALLEAVIRYWTALQNASPDALRGTFLLRPGKIALSPENEWVLQMESMSFDILLDQLPWGYSMVKLPWMPKMIRTK